MRYLGREGEIGRADAAALLGAQLEPDRFPAGSIDQHLPLMRLEPPFGAPQAQRDQHHAEFPTLIGQNILVPSAIGRRDLFENAAGDELLQPGREDVPGSTEAALLIRPTAGSLSPALRIGPA